MEKRISVQKITQILGDGLKATCFALDVIFSAPDTTRDFRLSHPESDYDGIVLFRREIDAIPANENELIAEQPASCQIPQAAGNR